ncbi:hypothetical protein ACFL4W_01600 [Planctomycetota bacterium]
MVALIFAAAIHSGCRRSDKDEPAAPPAVIKTGGEAAPAPPTDRQALEDAEKFLAEHPQALEQAQKHFEKVAFEHKETEGGKQARVRAEEIHVLWGRQVLTEWAATLEGEDAAKVLDEYSRLKEQFRYEEILSKADEHLEAWLQNRVAFEIDIIPQSPEFAVHVKLNCRGDIPQNRFAVDWSLAGRPAGSEFACVFPLTDIGPHPVRVSVSLLRVPLYSPEFKIGLREDAYIFWQAWFTSQVAAVPGADNQYFRVTRTDGEKFLAVKTATGFTADLKFGKVELPAAEVRTAVPVESREERLRQEVDRITTPIARRMFFLKQIDSKQLHVSVIRALRWWLLYLDPEDRDLQAGLNLLPVCPVCADSGTLHKKGEIDCRACHGKGDAKCSHCKGMGSVRCYQECYAGRIVVEQPDPVNRRMEAKWIKCPTCEGRARIVCPICEGALRAPCKQCKGRKTVIGLRQETCSTCKGKVPDLIPFTDIPYPFLAGYKPDPELERVRNRVRQQLMKEQGLSVPGAGTP